MALTTLREAILDQIAAELAAITVANGFEQTVKKVYRTGESTVTINEDPSLLMVDRGDTAARLVQFAYEMRLQLEIKTLTREYVTALKRQEVERLRADVIKRLMQDETHGGYAVATFVQGTDTRLPEVNDPDGIALVTVEVQYRVVESNPYQQQIL